MDASCDPYYKDVRVLPRWSPRARCQVHNKRHIIILHRTNRARRRWRHVSKAHRASIWRQCRAAYAGRGVVALTEALGSAVFTSSSRMRRRAALWATHATRHSLRSRRWRYSHNPTRGAVASVPSRLRVGEPAEAEVVLAVVHDDTAAQDRAAATEGDDAVGEVDGGGAVLAGLDVAEVADVAVPLGRRGVLAVEGVVVPAGGGAAVGEDVAEGVDVEAVLAGGEAGDLGSARASTTSGRQPARSRARSRAPEPVATVTRKWRSRPGAARVGDGDG